MGALNILSLNGTLCLLGVHAVGYHNYQRITKKKGMARAHLGNSLLFKILLEFRKIAVYFSLKYTKNEKIFQIIKKLHN